MSIFVLLVRRDSMNQELCTAEDSLAEALGRLRPTLTRRARAIIRNQADVEDIVQEAAVRAWGARSALRCDVDPAPWLNTIVTRVAIDYAQKERRRSSVLQRDLSPAKQPSVEDQLLQSEALGAVQTAADNLTRDHKRVLVLHDFIGLTSHEIARVEQIPYNTVRTRLRRARMSVRDRLERISA